MRPDPETPRWVGAQVPTPHSASATSPRRQSGRKLRLAEDPTGNRLFWLITFTVALAAGGLWTLLSALADSNSTHSPARRATPPAQPATPPAQPATPPAQPAGSLSPGSDPGFSPGARRRRQAVFALSDSLAGPFLPLGSPKAGDWLYSFKEPGQTIAEHRQQVTNRRTAARQTLHLLPFDDLSRNQQALLPTLQEFMTSYFGTSTVILPTRPLDRRWRNLERQQVDASPVLGELTGRVPRDSLGLVGLMRADLYHDDLSFVFGVALLHKRASIQSLSRFPVVGKRQRGLDRVFKLLAHEIGHMFGLEHCVFYRCLMNGTNSLAETDRSPLHLCPICLAKLQHSLGFDPAQRYRQLAAFYRKVGLPAEASFVSALAR